MDENHNLFATDPTLVYPIVGGNRRSPWWRTLARCFLLKHTSCAGCGTDNRKNLQVHHKKPYHLHPELELDETNLVAVCKYCHFVICHRNNWSFYVPDIDEELVRHWYGVQECVKQRIPGYVFVPVNTVERIPDIVPKRYADYEVEPDTFWFRLQRRFRLN